MLSAKLCVWATLSFIILFVLGIAFVDNNYLSIGVPLITTSIIPLALAVASGLVMLYNSRPINDEQEWD